MKSWLLLFVTALLFVGGQASAQQLPQPSGGAPMPPGPVPQIVAFDNEGLLGDHIHIFANTPDLGKWGNSISSMVILSGEWQFFDEEDFKGTPMGTRGPGVYLNLKENGLKDNSVSSIRLLGPAMR
jgi:hypothetical protein